VWPTPEKTFAAFELALRMGAHWLEQDLQLTADGELVVLHDARLDRTARGPGSVATGPVRERTLPELGACEVGSWFHPRFAVEPLPAFEAVVRRYAGRARLCVELKPELDGAPEALLAALARGGLRDPARLREEVVAQSFHPANLHALRALEPALPLVQLFRTAVGTAELHAQLDAVSAYAVGLGADLRRVDAGLVAAAHARGLRVHVYTANEPAQIAHALAVGVDAIISDFPDRVRARTAWTAPAARAA